jgi:hypothetical protein
MRTTQTEEGRMLRLTELLLCLAAGELTREYVQVKLAEEGFPHSIRQKLLERA